MASNKKKAPLSDETPELDETGDLSADGAEEKESGGDLTDEETSDPETSSESAVESVSLPKPPNDLHNRLTQAVRALTADVGQEKAFALHQLELLTGRLKMVLPSGIAAADSQLSEALSTLLALL